MFSSTLSLRKIEGFLRQVRQAQARALVDRHVLDRLALDRDLAAVGADQADDHVEAGRLAGAVRAEQADDLAALDREADAVDDGARPVRLAQALGFEPMDRLRRRDGAHFGTPIDGVSLRAGALAAAAPAAFASAAAAVPSLGISTARTRPPGLAAVFWAPPVTLKTSVALS